MCTTLVNRESSSQEDLIKKYISADKGWPKEAVLRKGPGDEAKAREAVVSRYVCIQGYSYFNQPVAKS